MNWSLQILLANMAATLFMVGLIWMVQIVHYPLFEDIGESNYVTYQQRHQANITIIVGPVMLLELATSILLALYVPEGVGKTIIFSGIALVALIWFSTAFIQVPCHEKLVRGFDLEAYKWLVNSNWIRTVAWTARGILVVWMVSSVLSK